MTLGWGVYGLGSHMRRRLLPALRESKDNHVAAVGHHKLETARQLAQELGIKKSYGSLEEMLKDDEVRAVVVATPNNLHYEHGMAVLKSKRQLLLEKPMTLEVGHARKLVKTASENRLILGVGFHLRHHPMLVEMRRRIAAGDIGEPLYLHASFGRAHDWPEGSWWGDAKLAGPQVLTGYGVHVLDLCRWMLDAELNSASASMRWEPANTFSSIHLEMSNGAICSLMCSTAIEHVPNTVEVMGRDGRLVGAGAVTTTDAGKLLRSTGSKVEMIDVTPRNPYLNQFESFRESVLNDKPFHADGIDGLNAVHALLAIIESAKNGRVAAVNREDRK